MSYWCDGARPWALGALSWDFAVGDLDLVVVALVDGFEDEIYEEPFIIYGLSPEKVAKKVKAFNPDVIGISVLFSMTISEVYKMCKALKKERKISGVLKL